MHSGNSFSFREHARFEQWIYQLWMRIVHLAKDPKAFDLALPLQVRDLRSGCLCATIDSHNDVSLREPIEGLTKQLAIEIVAYRIGELALPLGLRLILRYQTTLPDYWLWREQCCTACGSGATMHVGFKEDPPETSLWYCNQCGSHSEHKFSHR